MTETDTATPAPSQARSHVVKGGAVRKGEGIYGARSAPEIFDHAHFRYMIRSFSAFRAFSNFY